MTTNKLADRWHTRDFPVLLEAARQLDADGHADSRSIAKALSIDDQEAANACAALTPGYVNGTAHRGMGVGIFLFIVTGLTERGRRATGLWPDEDEAAEALIELLNQAADKSGDEEDAGALRKAGKLLRAVPSAVIADVTAALIRQQAGI